MIMQSLWLLVYLQEFTLKFTLKKNRGMNGFDISEFKVEHVLYGCHANLPLIGLTLFVVAL